MAKRKAEVIIEPVKPGRNYLPLAGAMTVLFVCAIVAFVLTDLSQPTRLDKAETSIGYVQNDVSALEGKAASMEATQNTILESLLSKPQPQYRPTLHRRKHRR